MKSLRARKGTKRWKHQKRAQYLPKVKKYSDK